MYICISAHWAFAVRCIRHFFAPPDVTIPGFSGSDGSDVIINMILTKIGYCFPWHCLRALIKKMDACVKYCYTFLCILIMPCDDGILSTKACIDRDQYIVEDDIDI